VPGSKGWHYSDQALADLIAAAQHLDEESENRIPPVLAIASSKPLRKHAIESHHSHIAAACGRTSNPERGLFR
jgi:hypothetical protein